MNTDRFKKVLVKRAQARFISSILSSIITIVFVSNVFTSDDWFLIFIVALGMSITLTQIFTAILHRIIFSIYYGGDEEAAEKEGAAFEAEMRGETLQQSVEESQQQIIQINLQIVDKPEKPYGHFMGSEIYEWIDIQGNDGKVYHCKFFGTADMSKVQNLQIPEDCFLLPPGIIYQVANPINNPT